LTGRIELTSWGTWRDRLGHHKKARERRELTRYGTEEGISEYTEILRESGGHSLPIEYKMGMSKDIKRSERVRDTHFLSSTVEISDDITRK
jgi:hypothetical protein